MFVKGRKKLWQNHHLYCPSSAPIVLHMAPTAPGSLESLRRRNRTAVLTAVRTGGRVSRADIARATGLSRSTVSTLVSDLIHQEIVRETAPQDAGKSGSGRPGTPLALNLSAAGVLAVDLAPRTIAAAIFDMGHQLLVHHTTQFDARTASIDEIVDQIDRIVERVVAESGIDRSAIIGGAVAVPAPIEQRTRVVGLQSGIPAIVGDALEPRLRERLAVPVILENDANLNALAEWTEGAATGHSDAIYVEFSEGIGAGLIVSGRLHRGAHGTAGEIGHTPIVADGPVCRCGNRGCLELVAGVGAITDAVNDQLGGALTIEDVVARARAGDPLCRRSLRDAASHIGTVIGSICNLINPTVVVVGGAIASAWPMIESAMREALDRSAIHVSIQNLELVPGKRSDTMGRLVGARSLVMSDPERFPTPTAA